MQHSVVVHPADCPCPSCRLVRWQAQKYKNQFYVDPSLPEETLVTCPMYEAYRFCPHGSVCFLEHNPEPPVPRPTDTLVDEIIAIDREHDDGIAICRVCGSTSINHFGFDRVLPTATCNVCCQPLYCPMLPELAETLAHSIPLDYQEYKNEVDRVREVLPNAFRIPFSKEAHRIGCSKFAWSLVSQEQVESTLDAAMEQVLAVTGKPADTVLSVGASSGYVEYLYAKAAEKLGNRVTVEAYDEIPNPRFDVAVEVGGPERVREVARASTVLLLCWPPFGSQEKDLSTMGYDTLTNFYQAGGVAVIYIGDESSTGDFRYHGLLAMKYKPAPGYRVRHEVRRWVPQEMGMVFAGQDTVGVYVRRPSDGTATTMTESSATAGAASEGSTGSLPALEPPILASG